VQPSDTLTTEKTSRTCLSKKEGNLFFTSPRVRAEPADKESPAFPYRRSGKIVLKTSPKSKAGSGGRSKKSIEPNWLDELDDVFSFHAED